MPLSFTFTTNFPSFRKSHLQPSILAEYDKQPPQAKVIHHGKHEAFIWLCHSVGFIVTSLYQSWLFSYECTCYFTLNVLSITWHSKEKKWRRLRGNNPSRQDKMLPHTLYCVFIHIGCWSAQQLIWVNVWEIINTVFAHHINYKI